MKRRLTTSAVLAAGLLLAACGGSDPGQPDAADTPSAAPADDETAEDAPTEPAPDAEEEPETDAELDDDTAAALNEALRQVGASLDQLDADLAAADDATSDEGDQLRDAEVDR